MGNLMPRKLNNLPQVSVELGFEPPKCPSTLLRTLRFQNPKQAPVRTVETKSFHP